MKKNIPLLYGFSFFDQFMGIALSMISGGDVALQTLLSPKEASP